MTFRLNKTVAYKAALDISQCSLQIRWGHPEVRNLQFPTSSAMPLTPCGLWSRSGHTGAYVPMGKLFYIIFPFCHNAGVWVTKNRLKGGNEELTYHTGDPSGFILENKNSVGARPAKCSQWDGWQEGTGVRLEPGRCRSGILPIAFVRVDEI